MSKATYLHSLTEWTRTGSHGLAPDPAAHGVSLADVTGDEYAKARDAGDPRPHAISNWTWWDGTHEDLPAWHRGIRDAYQGGATFTTEERKCAELLYAQTYTPHPRPSRRRNQPRPATQGGSSMTDRWSDHFTLLSSREVGANGGWKTTKANEITWQG